MGWNWLLDRKLHFSRGSGSGLWAVDLCFLDCEIDNEQLSHLCSDPGNKVSLHNNLYQPGKSYKDIYSSLSQKYIHCFAGNRQFFATYFSQTLCRQVVILVLFSFSQLEIRNWETLNKQSQSIPDRLLSGGVVGWL